MASTNENDSIIAENDDDEEVDDEEVDDEEVDNQEDDEEEEEEEESYLQSLTQEVVDLHDDIVQSYVTEPDTPQELCENQAAKKFIVQKVRKRLLDSFESHQQWVEDEELVAMVKKCKSTMSKSDELDAVTAMKRIIKNEQIIGELVEAAIEEAVDGDDDEEKEDDEDAP